MSRTAPESDYLEVTVTGGRIRGRRNGAVASFLGIPYGADTGGSNRYLPPQPVEPWSGVRDTLRVGRVCPQVPLTDSLPTRHDVEAALNLDASITDDCSDRENMGEDCLNLNLWAPASAGREARLPVLVWLHGGAWTSGSANLKRTEGHNLAKRGDVVVVAVNHRLGAFGYLHLAKLSANPTVVTLTSAQRDLRR